MNIQGTAQIPSTSHPSNQNRRNLPEKSPLPQIIMESRTPTLSSSLQTITITKPPENISKANTFISNLFPSNVSEETSITLGTILWDRISELEKAPIEASIQAECIRDLLFISHGKLANQSENIYTKHARKLLEKTKKVAYFHSGA